MDYTIIPKYTLSRMLIVLHFFYNHSDKFPGSFPFISKYSKSLNNIHLKYILRNVYVNFSPI